MRGWKQSNNWSESAFKTALDQILERMRLTGLSGTNQRWVLRELLNRDQQLTEIGSGIFQIGEGDDARFIRGTVTDEVSFLLQEIQSDKVAAAHLMRLHGIPTTEHRRVRDRQQAFAAAAQLGYPVVLKPFNGTQGKRVFSELQDRRRLIRRWPPTAAISPTRWWSSSFRVFRWRIFVMNGRILWIVGRLHQYVTGDGERSVDQLIRDYCSEEIEDGSCWRRPKSDPDEFYEKFQIFKRLTPKRLKSVLPAGERLRLTDLPSASVGAVQAVFSQEQLSPKVLETVQYLSWLFGDAPLGIDAIGELVDGQFRHLVFNEVNFGPQILRPKFTEDLH